MSKLSPMTQFFIDQLKDAAGADIADRIQAAAEERFFDHIMLGWTDYDVISYLLSCGYFISESDAHAVLLRVERKHDAEYGVTWDTLRDTATDEEIQKLPECVHCNGDGFFEDIVYGERSNDPVELWCSCGEQTIYMPKGEMK